mmetsp:Transcript_32168/g.47522  ORF Transcript_32168/g.47522 Transcript_32168/m.47522 type:complete len:969 (+) Transcript_32168:536-3442(+)
MPTDIPTSPSSTPSIMCDPKIDCPLPGTGIIGSLVCLPWNNLCVPDEAVQILIVDGYCGECSVPSQQPSFTPTFSPSSSPTVFVPTRRPTTSLQPTVTPSTSLAPSASPSGPLDGCAPDSIEYCNTNGDVYFCFDGTAQFCLPQSLVTRYLRVGNSFCGRCPRVTVSPTISPTGPSSVPSGALDDCAPVEVCTGVDGGRIRFCLNGTNTICVPRGNIQGLLASMSGFCGRCPTPLPSMYPSPDPTVSLQPIGTPSISVSPSRNPASGALDGCEPNSVEFCNGNFDVFFCLVDDNGADQLCLAQDLVPSYLTIGTSFCGKCPRVTTVPTITPTDIVPSSAPSGVYNNCDDIMFCSEEVEGNRVQFCLNGKNACVPSGDIQSLLASGGGFCGLCPTPLPSAYPTEDPTVSLMPTGTPSLSSRPSSNPTGLLENCVPAEKCDDNGAGYWVCINNDYQSCLPDTLIQDVLNTLGGVCGRCPTPSPSTAPSGRPSVTASENPTPIPSLSLVPSQAPTGIVDICDPDPVEECAGIDPNQKYIWWCSDFNRYCFSVNQIKAGQAPKGYCGTCRVPSTSPSEMPSPKPTKLPSFSPSDSPTVTSSDRPSRFPSTMPSLGPSRDPSTEPSQTLSEYPTSKPSSEPTSTPSGIPSSPFPSLAPSSSPSNSLVPSESPTGALDECFPRIPCTTEEGNAGVIMCISLFISIEYCAAITDVQDLIRYFACGRCPTDQPSMSPSSVPTGNPTSALSESPSVTASENPTSALSESPSLTASENPSSALSELPSVTASEDPSAMASSMPSRARSLAPSETLNLVSATASPTVKASSSPSSEPSFAATNSPRPSQIPTSSPAPTPAPSSGPSRTASASPSNSEHPSMNPSASPAPSPAPTMHPSKSPMPSTNPSSSALNGCMNDSRGRVISCKPDPEPPNYDQSIDYYYYFCYESDFYTECTAEDNFADLLASAGYCGICPPPPP